MKLIHLLGKALLLLALVGLFSGQALAGKLVNKDKQAYEYGIWWDDLSLPITGEIGPGETVEFEEKACTIELPERHDSIYVKGEETIIIRGGILRNQ